MQVRSRAETEIIHRGEGPVETAAPLTLPIYETTTFLFESAEEVRRYNEGRSARYLYSRYENPTVQAVEAKIAALEEAEAALLFGSGMGATATTLLALAKAGDEIVCSASVYGGTFHLIADLLPRLGVRARFASLDELRAQIAQRARHRPCHQRPRAEALQHEAERRQLLRPCRQQGHLRR